MKKKVVFDFGDGRGETPAYQHINPDGSKGGWIAESVEISVEVKAKLFVHIDAKISGYFKTVIWGGEIWGGEIWGGEIWGGEIRGGVIKTNKDFFVFAGVGSRDDCLTVQFDSGEPLFTTGCKTRITLQEFESANEESHGDNRFGLEYKVMIKTVQDIWEIRKNTPEDE